MNSPLSSKGESICPPINSDGQPLYQSVNMVVNGACSFEARCIKTKGLCAPDSVLSSLQDKVTSPFLKCVTRSSKPRPRSSVSYYNMRSRVQFPGRTSRQFPIRDYVPATNDIPPQFSRSTPRGRLCAARGVLGDRSGCAHSWGNQRIARRLCAVPHGSRRHHPSCARDSARSDRTSRRDRNFGQSGPTYSVRFLLL